MYRQILIQPNHGEFQRILWRFSSDSIEEYWLNTVTYGVSFPPFLALCTLQELDDLEKDRFPEASKVIKHNVYVDDVVIGSTSLKEALSIQNQLIQL
ncbi:hypothetical protein NQ317_008018 [Molorchus minor]|uniref:Reverse transcriptase domain-containing protein n=1 Tax=Molorchus minor TaxID=1323400 RepID=A0ABQ9JWI0_9CUCU|nr:hypothetical protein NQ317_008018 [Molorchus minor]